MQYRRLIKSRTGRDQKPKRQVKRYKQKTVSVEKGKKEYGLKKQTKSDTYLKRKKSKQTLEEDVFYSPTGDYALKSPDTDTYYDAEDKRTDFGDNYLETFKKMAEEGEEEAQAEEVFSLEK